MIYLDDESRDDFHKAGHLLQVICASLEYEAAKHSAQLELHYVKDGVATLHVDIDDLDVLMEVCIKVNERFKRADKKPTCKITDRDLRFVKCVATSVDDLAELA